jgi:hypothetical protein
VPQLTLRIPLALTSVTALGLALLVPGAATPAVGAATPGLPTVERGLDFSASLVTDPQRSQGESAAFTDPKGVLYSCGTNGFSNATDHGSVSVDGGETWRPLGTGPIGETGTIQGGGDCAIASGQQPNEQGNHQLAFIGLGPLTGFSTFSSPDNGRTLQRSPDQNGLEKFNTTTLVDRQWLTFTDEQTVFLNYNAAVVSVPGGPTGQIIQKSTDGGLTFGPQYSAATDGDRLGQIRTIPEGVLPGVPADKDVVYFPYNSGNLVKLAMSLDGGETFSQCLAVDAEVDPTAGFVTADHDSAGNLYVVYSENAEGTNDTYLVALKAADVAKCKGPNPVAASQENNVDPGFTKKIRINREGIETTVMPWVTAGGAPGRVAVSYYGTEPVGDPASGDFKAAWHVYVNQTLDVFAPKPDWDQARATTHPNHYDSICLTGLGCTVTSGDRSLVDYFTMAFDPASGRLLVVYNQASKRPDDAEGLLAQPVALVQRAGPSNAGDGKTVSGPPVLRTGGTDKPGDALPRWTTRDGVLGSPTTSLPGGENQPALDLLDVKVGPEVDLESGEPVADGGFTVTMTYDDLSTTALNAALTGAQGTSLVYLFRFFDGFQPGGAMAYYEPARGGWRFGETDYNVKCATSTSSQCQNDEPRNPRGNIQTYQPEASIPGKVDTEAGRITLSVPRDRIEALLPPAGDDSRPTEGEAVLGSRVFDASAWSFVNTLPVNDEQSFLMQSDNTSAFDFVLSAAGNPPPVTVPEPPTQAAPPETSRPGGSRLPATGGLGAPLLAIALISGAAAVRRRRRPAEPARE